MNGKSAKKKKKKIGDVQIKAAFRTGVSFTGRCSFPLLYAAEASEVAKP